MDPTRIPVVFILTISSLIFTIINSVEKSDKSFILLHPPRFIQVSYISFKEATVIWYQPQVYRVNESYLEFALNSVNATPHLAIEVAPGDNIEENTTTAVETTTSQTTNTDSTTVNTSNVTTNSSSETVQSTASTSATPTDTTLSDLQVPYDDGIIIAYLVYVKAETEDVYKVNETREREFHLRNLQPGTNYSVIISVGYRAEDYNGSVNGSVYLNSTEVIFTTKNNYSERECVCNDQGVVDTTKKCDYSQPYWCNCKEGYAGVFCESCALMYYSLGPKVPCRRCPCSLKSSTGTCSFYKGNMRCDQCHQGYEGNLCHQCAFGYYVYDGRCTKCNCHGNGDVRSKYLCDDKTGACTACLYNTTGFSCERCLDGYVGDPLAQKNCRLKSDVPGHSSKFNVGVVAAICISVILLLSVITGILVYRQCHGLPNRMPFWTVELKEDHEGVNFSTLPEQDEHMISASAPIDDMDFYDSIKGHESSQRYSPLKETV